MVVIFYSIHILNVVKVVLSLAAVITGKTLKVVYSYLSLFDTRSIASNIMHGCLKTILDYKINKQEMCFCCIMELNPT